LPNILLLVGKCSARGDSCSGNSQVSEEDIYIWKFCVGCFWKARVLVIWLSVGAGAGAGAGLGSAIGMGVGNDRFSVP
jgi:hypothetical protein